MRVVAVSQARMTSTRLPGKILKIVRDRTLLEWHIERLKRCRMFDDIVVATTSNAADDALLPICKDLGVRCHRGSEHDVLSRFLGAARGSEADMIVRVTSDCPLWDPEEGARVVNALRSSPQADYACNVLERTYPRGLDTEAFWIDVLCRLDRMASPGQNADREHVTNAVHDPRRATLFRTISVSGSEDDSDLRWCVDTPEDLSCVEAILHKIPDPFAPYPEVLSVVRRNPEIARLNVGVKQKPS